MEITGVVVWYLVDPKMYSARIRVVCHGNKGPQACIILRQLTLCSKTVGSALLFVNVVL